MKNKHSKKLVATALVGTAFLAACGQKEEAPVVEEPMIEAPAEDAEVVVDTEGYTGVASVETPYGDGEDVVVTAITFENGQPVDLSLDVRLADGSLKSEVSLAGDYVMSEDEDALAWHEQMEALVTFVKENNFDLTVVTLTDEAGHTDAVTGVSIKISEYLKGIELLLEQVQTGAYDAEDVSDEVETAVELEETESDVEADADAESEVEADEDTEDADADAADVE